jgi:uncharacterized protein (DUF924 family)
MTISRSLLDEVHYFWFGALGAADAPAAMAQVQKWFRRDDAFDTAIRERFGAAIAPAADADWDLPALTQAQQVGLVVLLDQFPRNIHRDSGEAFACDARARGIAAVVVAAGLARFHPQERRFVLLPFEHSEAVADQDRAVLLAAQAIALAPPAALEPARIDLDFATRHRDVIRRFGRFPHRNAVLGRESTPEEEAFLNEHGRGF